jgi:predicted nucleic acid-binding protein
VGLFTKLAERYPATLKTRKAFYAEMERLHSYSGGLLLVKEKDRIRVFITSKLTVEDILNIREESVYRNAKSFDKFLRNEIQSTALNYENNFRPPTIYSAMEPKTIKFKVDAALKTLELPLLPIYDETISSGFFSLNLPTSLEYYALGTTENKKKDIVHFVDMFGLWRPTGILKKLNTAIGRFCNGIEIFANGKTSRVLNVKNWMDGTMLPEFQNQWIASGNIDLDDMVQLYSIHPQVHQSHQKAGQFIKQIVDADFPAPIVKEYVLSNDVENLETLLASPLSWVLPLSEEPLKFTQQGFSTSDQKAAHWRNHATFELRRKTKGTRKASGKE